MLNCKQTSELVSQSFDRPLSLKERLSVGFHLLICAACKRFNYHLALMQSAMMKLRSGIEQNEQLQLSRQARARISRVLLGSRSG
jgi:hypothetical protein